MSRLSRAAPAAVAALFGAAFAAGCIERGYPLGSGGSVDVHLDTNGSLFAADVLDSEGKGELPRQAPYRTGVTLIVTEGTQAANGAFVDVRVEPAEALALSADDKEAGEERTCVAKDGKFRCTATPEGIARFIVTSEGNWSGDAKLIFTWADQRKEVTVDVLPAGLPPTAKDFTIVATGLADSDRVLPSYSALACTTIDTLPSDLGSKWRPGFIRAREAFVRASAPLTEPGVVANAPVIVQSLSSEAALSLDDSCSVKSRVTRLRLLLGDSGETPSFYLCFSDIGGEAEFSVSSGSLSIAPNPTLNVDAEPRVLRVAALSPTVEEGLPDDLFEIAAFNTDLDRIAMAVDVESSDPSVLKLTKASETLAPEGTDPTRLIVSPLKPGTAVLHVRPRLFKKPDCASIEITVNAALP